MSEISKFSGQQLVMLKTGECNRCEASEHTVLAQLALHRTIMRGTEVYGREIEALCPETALPFQYRYVSTSIQKQLRSIGVPEITIEYPADTIDTVDTLGVELYE